MSYARRQGSSSVVGRTQAAPRHAASWLTHWWYRSLSRLSTPPPLRLMVFPSVPNQRDRCADSVTTASARRHTSSSANAYPARCPDRGSRSPGCAGCHRPYDAPARRGRMGAHLWCSHEPVRVSIGLDIHDRTNVTGRCAPGDRQCPTLTFVSARRVGPFRSEQAREPLARVAC